MTTVLELKWMLIPFLACLVLSINHVYLGIHVIARKVIFVDLALAQIAALGATYALTLGYDPYGDSFKVSLFSLAFTFVGATAFAIARMRKERVPQEAFIGIIYAAASAAAILILSKSATGGEELKHMLVGDLLLVSLRSVMSMALLYGSIGVFHLIFRKRFLAISLNPEAAEASGMNIRLWDILFYMSFGVVIVKSVAIVGVLLVFLVPRGAGSDCRDVGDHCARQAASGLVDGHPGQFRRYRVVVLLRLSNWAGCCRHAESLFGGFFHCLLCIPRSSQRTGHCQCGGPVVLRHPFLFRVVAVQEERTGNSRVQADSDRPFAE